jgi:hypothetical protein
MSSIAEGVLEKVERKNKTIWERKSTVKLNIKQKRAFQGTTALVG